MVKYIPEKGCIIHLNFDPSLRHEQKESRYAVVVSHHIFNKNTSMCYTVPITSKCKDYSTQVKIKTRKVKGCALIYSFKRYRLSGKGCGFSGKTSRQTIRINI